MTDLEGLLIITIIIMGVFLYQLSGDVDKIQADISEAKKNDAVIAKAHDDHLHWHVNVLGANLNTDFANVHAVQQQLFLVLWEYFYILCTTQGLVAVNKDNFFDQGLNDIKTKYPGMFDFMTKSETCGSQKELFAYWENHYKTALLKNLVVDDNGVKK